MGSWYDVLAVADAIHLSNSLDSLSRGGLPSASVLRRFRNSSMSLVCQVGCSLSFPSDVVELCRLPSLDGPRKYELDSRLIGRDGLRSPSCAGLGGIVRPRWLCPPGCSSLLQFGAEDLLP
jgi:hypothetical protein